MSQAGAAIALGERPAPASVPFREPVTKRGYDFSLLLNPAVARGAIARTSSSRGIFPRALHPRFDMVWRPEAPRPVHNSCEAVADRAITAQNIIYFE